MKFVSSMNMDQCLTEEGVSKLHSRLMSFIKDHKIMDSSIFDEVSVKAKNLNNKKLVEQCRVAKSRCEETKQVIKVREMTIMKAREEIEAQTAKRISVEKLASDTKIVPVTKSTYISDSTNGEDIWVPRLSLHVEDSNNNQKQKTGQSDNQATTTSLSTPTRTVSHDTLASSEEDLLTSSIPAQVNSVSPVAADHQSEESLVKRKSFAGFTSSSSNCYAARSQHKSSLEGHTLSEQDESVTELEPVMRLRSSTVLDCLEELNHTAANPVSPLCTLKSKTIDNDLTITRNSARNAIWYVLSTILCLHLSSVYLFSV